MIAAPALDAAGAVALVLSVQGDVARVPMPLRLAAVGDLERGLRGWLCSPIAAPDLARWLAATMIRWSPPC